MFTSAWLARFFWVVVLRVSKRVLCEENCVSSESTAFSVLSCLSVIVFVTLSSFKIYDVRVFVKTVWYDLRVSFIIFSTSTKYIGGVYIFDDSHSFVLSSFLFTGIFKDFSRGKVVSQVSKRFLLVEGFGGGTSGGDD